MASNNKVLIKFLLIVRQQEVGKTGVSELVQRMKVSDEKVKIMVVPQEQHQIQFLQTQVFILIEKVNLYLKVFL